MGEAFIVEPIAHVVGGRTEPTDDYWGGVRAIVRIDEKRFTPESVKGLDAFSHLEVVFAFILRTRRILISAPAGRETTQTGRKWVSLVTET